MAHEGPNITSEKSLTGVEVPRYLFKGITKEFVSLLPDYFPEEIKQKLIEEHEDPYILIKYNDRDEQGFRADTPKNVTQEDTKFWIAGAIFLNELAIDSLAIRIIEQKDQSFDNPFPNTVHTSLAKLQPEGLSDMYVGFIEHLQIACITGERNNIDEYLRNNFDVENLEELMISIGKKLTPREQVQEDSSGKGNQEITFGRQKGNSIQINPYLLKYPISYLASGLVGVPMIGIAINSMGNNSNSALEFLSQFMIGTSGFLAGSFSLHLLSKIIKPVKNSIKHTIYHELAHYISNDFKVKRFGLFQLSQ